MKRTIAMTRCLLVAVAFLFLAGAAGAARAEPARKAAQEQKRPVNEGIETRNRIVQATVYAVSGIFVVAVVSSVVRRRRRARA